MVDPPTILVVDDDRAVVSLLCAILEDEGYAVMSANDGKQALVMARANRPDLVLTDVMMPFFSGVQLCIALSADPRTQTIPVVLMSAGHARTIRAACPTAHFLPKPFVYDELLDLIARLARPPEPP
jgi:two-component system, sensor histidine kinase and response regulator